MSLIADTTTFDRADFTQPMRHPLAGDACNGMWFSETEPLSVDTKKLRDGRLARLRAWMVAAGYGAVLLFDRSAPAADVLRERVPDPCLPCTAAPWRRCIASASPSPRWRCWS